MKRSEMIEEIAEVLKGGTGNEIGLAKDILDVIEAAGMEPPLVEIARGNSEGIGEWSESINRWEDEG